MTLKELRISRKVGAREAARRMETNHSLILRFESVGVAHLETVEKYAAAIEVPFRLVYEASRETRGLPPLPV